MSTEDRTTLASIILVLVILTLIGVSRLPQKWKACQKLYDNKPAQVLCFMVDS